MFCAMPGCASSACAAKAELDTPGLGEFNRLRDKYDFNKTRD